MPTFETVGRKAKNSISPFLKETSWNFILVLLNSRISECMVTQPQIRLKSTAFFSQDHVLLPRKERKINIVEPLTVFATGTQDSQYPRETKDFESIFFPDDFFTHVDVKYIILSALILGLKKKYSIHTCQYFTVEGYLTFNLHITFFNDRN